MFTIGKRTSESKIEKSLNDSDIALDNRKKPKKEREHLPKKKMAAIIAAIEAYITSKKIILPLPKTKLGVWRYEGLKLYMSQRQQHNMQRQYSLWKRGF